MASAVRVSLLPHASPPPSVGPDPSTKLQPMTHQQSMTRPRQPPSLPEYCTTPRLTVEDIAPPPRSRFLPPKASRRVRPSPPCRANRPPPARLRQSRLALSRQRVAGRLVLSAPSRPPPAPWRPSPPLFAQAHRYVPLFLRIPASCSASITRLMCSCDVLVSSSIWETPNACSRPFFDAPGTQHTR